MLASVTQNLIVRVSPVNTPLKENGWGEVLGYYRAYVAGGDNDERVFIAAESETMRGIVPMTVGYGTHATARMAVLNAIDDYESKFGPIAVADTDNN
jgi:hypothetical protein